MTAISICHPEEKVCKSIKAKCFNLLLFEPSVLLALRSTMVLMKMSAYTLLKFQKRL